MSLFFIEGKIIGVRNARPEEIFYCLIDTIEMH